MVVHNGIITNYKEIKQFLVTKGFTFESDTDTEAVAKLIQHIHSQSPGSTFRQLVEQTISQLEGAFACVFKSTIFPGEAVATRRGSPMVVGIKSESGLESDSIPVHNNNNNIIIVIITIIIRCTTAPQGSRASASLRRPPRGWRA